MPTALRNQRLAKKIVQWCLGVLVEFVFVKEELRLARVVAQRALEPVHLCRMVFPKSKQLKI